MPTVNDRVLAIIPAFNEEAALPGVLAALRDACPDLDVVVVSDGSGDDTAGVARTAGATVVELPFNLGIGGALQTGFRFATRHGYQRAVQIDADGQHDPGQISVLLAALDGGADLVIGSRFEPSGRYRVSVTRGGAMGLMRFGLRLLSGRHITDTSSGFRAFSGRCLALFAARYPADYLESVEALLLALRAGLEVVEVPVTMRQRQAGRASNRNLRLAYHFIRLAVVMVSSAGRQPREAQPMEAHPMETLP